MFVSLYIYTYMCFNFCTFHLIASEIHGLGFFTVYPPARERPAQVGAQRKPSSTVRATQTAEGSVGKRTETLMASVKFGEKNHLKRSSKQVPYLKTNMAPAIF